MDKEEYLNKWKKTIEQQAKIIQKVMQLKTEEIKNFLIKEKNEKNNIKSNNNKDNNNNNKLYYWK